MNTSLPTTDNMPDVRVWSATSLDVVAALIPNETRASVQTQINVDLDKEVLSLSPSLRMLVPNIIFDSIPWNGGEGGGIWRNAPAQADRDAALQQLSFPSTQSPYAFLFPLDKLQALFASFFALHKLLITVDSVAMQPQAPNLILTQIHGSFDKLSLTIFCTTTLTVNSAGVVTETTTYQTIVDLSWWQKLLGFLFLGPFFADLDAGFSGFASSAANGLVGDQLGAFVADTINSFHSMLIAGTTQKLVFAIDTITCDSKQGIFATGGKGFPIVELRKPSVTIVGASKIEFFDSGQLMGWGWKRGMAPGSWTLNAFYQINTTDMRSPFNVVWSTGQPGPDGTTVAVPVTYYPARGPSLFNLSVKVTDADGQTASASLNVDVVSVAPPPPPKTGHGPIRKVQQN